MGPLLLSMGLQPQGRHRLGVDEVPVLWAILVGCGRGEWCGQHVGCVPLCTGGILVLPTSWRRRIDGTTILVGAICLPWSLGLCRLPCLAAVTNLRPRERALVEALCQSAFQSLMIGLLRMLAPSDNVTASHVTSDGCQRKAYALRASIGLGYN